MAEHNNERPDRVTLRDIYEATDRIEKKFGESFATKTELRLWVLLGIAGGQGIAATVTALVTGSTPVGQAAWLYAHLKGAV